MVNYEDKNINEIKFDKTMKNINTLKYQNSDILVSDDNNESNNPIQPQPSLTNLSIEPTDFLNTLEINEVLTLNIKTNAEDFIVENLNDEVVSIEKYVDNELSVKTLKITALKEGSSEIIIKAKVDDKHIENQISFNISVIDDNTEEEIPSENESETEEGENNNENSIIDEGNDSEVVDEE